MRSVVDEEAFRKALHTGPLGIAVVDAGGRFVEVNQTLCDMLGYQQNELEGRGWIDISHPEDLAANLPLNSQLFQGRIPSFRLRKRYLRKDGSCMWAMLYAHAVVPTEGPIKYAIGVVEDITDRVEADVEQQQSFERIRALHGELERTIAELQRSNEDLQQFAYVTSHDLREPLRTIAGFSELLSRRLGDSLEDEHREFLDYVIQAATRMDRLILDLLAYSSVGASLRLQRVCCTDLVKEATVHLAGAVADSGAEVVHGELPTVMADSLLLRQVFQNLIGNAIKFHGPNPPRVEVAAERHDAEWRFSVRDNGIGLEPSQAQRVFLLFQRLHPQSEYPGNGIGLAVCKKIVERHGGRLWVESTPGQGSTFHFTLGD